MIVDYWPMIVDYCDTKKAFFVHLEGRGGGGEGGGNFKFGFGN